MRVVIENRSELHVTNACRNKFTFSFSSALLVIPGILLTKKENEKKKIHILKRRAVTSIKELFVSLN